MTTTFLGSLEELERRAPGPLPRWLVERRREARDRFEKQGLPTQRDEEWRNTNLAPIAGTRFAGAASAAVPARYPGRDWLEPGAAGLTFVNGVYAPEHSTTQGLPRELWAGSLAAALERIPERLRGLFGTLSSQECTAFESLNTAFAGDGSVILVPAGLQLEAPLHVTHLSVASGRPVLSHPRTLIVAGAESRVRLLELFVPGEGGGYLTNAVAEVHVGENASVEHVRVQLESEDAFHVSTLVSRQSRDSRYTNHNIDLGGRLVRHNLRAILDGEGAYCDLLGVYLTGGSQHVDNHTVLDHASPNCGSREVYKGILDGSSRAVFRGRIIVRGGAQKTDAKQSNPNLVLSSRALAHTRPQLEIYADDVRCTHGATVGRLDEEAIFYLRSRAIPEREARNMMIRAFADEALDRISVEPWRRALHREVARRLAEGAA